MSARVPFASETTYALLAQPSGPGLCGAVRYLNDGAYDFGHSQGGFHRLRRISSGWEPSGAARWTLMSILRCYW